MTPRSTDADLVAGHDVSRTSGLPLWAAAFPITAGIHLLRRTWIREQVLRAWIEDPAAAAQPWYLDYATLTRVHLVTGALLTVLGFLQFVPRLRAEHPKIHRWVGRSFVVIGAVAAVTGIWMNFVFPIGHPLKYAGGYFFGVVVLVSVALGVRAIRRGQVFAHRVWMSRAFAIVIAAGMQRVLIAIWERHLDGMVTEAIVGTCLWLGAALALGTNELLLRRVAAAERSTAMPPSVPPTRAR